MRPVIQSRHCIPATGLPTGLVKINAGQFTMSCARATVSLACAVRLARAHDTPTFGAGKAGCHHRRVERLNTFNIDADNLVSNGEEHRLAIMSQIKFGPTTAGFPVTERWGLIRGKLRVHFLDNSMVAAQRFSGPFGPVKGARLEFFQVEIEDFGHGFNVASSISRQLNESKC